MEASNQSDVASTGQLFDSISRESTFAARVAQQIEELIEAGRLRPGDQLPPERELARQFGVSRTVIREAVRGLAAKNLLEVRSGGGTTVSGPTVQSVAQSMSMLLRNRQPSHAPDKVLEVRELLEVAIARLAAERHSPHDIERLEGILREAEAHQDDRDRFSQLDVDFHAALAAATHNDLFSVLLDSIADVMYKVRQMGFDVPGMPDRALHFHRAILEQIKAGDAEGAGQAMIEHMSEAAQTMQLALSRRQEQDV